MPPPATSRPTPPSVGTTGATQPRGRMAAWAGRSRLCRAVGRLDDRGAAMLEFAIAAMPFFLMLFGTLELGMVFVTNMCLTNATQTIARQVRVGTTTLPGAATLNGTGTQMTLSGFKTAVCAGIPIMPTTTCLAQLQVDVRTQASFGTAAAPSPNIAGNFTTAGFCFYSGAPGNVVTMRAYLLWPIMTPGLLSMLSTASTLTTSSGTSTGTFLVLTASEAFKNEPNPTTTNTGNGC